jgi:3-methyladenine DNA glycosylase AlkD
MATLDNLRKDLRKFERPEKAKFLKRFFKTGKGEYAEGDLFLGLMTNETRAVAKKFSDLSFPDLAKLLSSRIHEERVVALMILSKRFDKAGSVERKEIYQFYLENLDGVNNWDLVDGSAANIIGKYLFESKESRDFLFDYAKSDNLWKRRIAMMSTFFYIKQNDFKDALIIAEILLNDKHDLIHKAVGWMLREIGNRDLNTEEEFLKKYYKKMPRTMLRYAIEKFPESLRKEYLYSKI